MSNRIGKIRQWDFLYKLIIILLSILLYPLAMFIDLYFKNVLFFQDNKIDTNVSVQSEMNNGSKFWWLTENTTYLSLINKAPYNVNAKVSLKIEENPCGEIPFFSVRNKNEELYSNTTINPKTLKFIYIDLPVEIKRFETLILEIEPKVIVECKVENGDNRKFLAKMSEFRIEYN